MYLVESTNWGRDIKACVTQSWSWALLEKPPIVRHFMELELSLPCAQEPSTGPYPEPDQSNPSHSISVRSILIFSTYLYLGLSSGLSPFGFPTNILYPFFFSPIRCSCPAHLIFLDLIILLTIWRRVKVTNFKACVGYSDWSATLRPSSNATATGSGIFLVILPVTSCAQRRGQV
jgi:hypothetical protein